MRSKIVESFEAFTKDNLEYLMMYKKTYVKNFERESKSGEIFDKIKNYDLNKFKIIMETYGIFIYPDKEFIKLAKKLDNSVNHNLFFYVTVAPSNNNQIDFTEGVPEFMRGLSIGYKIYKLVIDRVGWITSDRYSTQHAYNLWYNLLQDMDLYCFTSNTISGLISKNISDTELDKIVNRFIDLAGIEFDDELEDKINKHGR